MGVPNADRPVRLLPQHVPDRMDNTLGSYRPIFVVLYI